MWMSKGSFWYQFLFSSLPSCLTKAFLLLTTAHTRLIDLELLGILLPLVYPEEPGLIDEYYGVWLLCGSRGLVSSCLCSEHLTW